MHDLRWELATGVEGIERLAPSWQQLARQIADRTHIHLWEWYRSLLGHVAPAPAQIHFAVARATDDVVAIVPIVKRAGRVGGIPCTVLALPEHDHMAYADAIIAPGWVERLSLPQLERGLAELLGHFDALLLAPVLADAAVSLLVRRGGAPVVTEALSQSDNLPTRPYPELLARLSKNFRGNLRKARNKLGQQRDVAVRVARTPADLQSAFTELLAVEASGWKGHDGTGTAIALDARVTGFYRELVERLGATGQCEIRVLSLAGVPIAAQLAVLTGRRAFLLKIGYDERHAALAPGNMLLERTLESLAGDRDIAWVDLVTNAGWHTHWAPEARLVVQHFGFAATMRGRMAWATMHGKQALRPVREALRAPAHAAKPPLI